MCRLQQRGPPRKKTNKTKTDQEGSAVLVDALRPVQLVSPLDLSPKQKKQTHTNTPTRCRNIKTEHDKG